MKKYFITAASGLILLLCLSSCFHHHNFSISVSDDEDEYKMDALYNKNRSHFVQVYLDDHLMNSSTVSFKDRDYDDEINLDNDTKIYINSHPGRLKIKINKRNNSKEACDEIKQVCEDLKDILADN
jgi:hypothetical protein